MKKIFWPLFAVIVISVIACNSGTDHSHHTGTDKPKTLADSLEQDIEEVHNVGMAKMGPLTKLQQKTKYLIDSIDKLPARFREKTASYKQKLDTLLKELNYAEFAMDKWMPEFFGKKDTLINEPAERIKYLISEKLKADKIKQNILEGIQKADSLLREKL